MPPRVRAMRRKLSLVAIETTASRKLARSSRRSARSSARSLSPVGAPNLASKSSGLTSWWSKEVAHPPAPPAPREQEEEVGRVAAVDEVEAARGVDLGGEPAHVAQRVGVLAPRRRARPNAPPAAPGSGGSRRRRSPRRRRPSPGRWGRSPRPRSRARAAWWPRARRGGRAAPAGSRRPSARGAPDSPEARSSRFSPRSGPLWRDAARRSKLHEGCAPRRRPLPTGGVAHLPAVPRGPTRRDPAQSATFCETGVEAQRSDCLGWHA